MGVAVKVPGGWVGTRSVGVRVGPVAIGKTRKRRRRGSINTSLAHMASSLEAVADRQTRRKRNKPAKQAAESAKRFASLPLLKNEG